MMGSMIEFSHTFVMLYVSFDWSNPNVAHDRINLCISDLGIWMFRNKLKFNDSKTEIFNNYFIDFKTKF